MNPTHNLIANHWRSRLSGAYSDLGIWLVIGAFTIVVVYYNGSGAAGPRLASSLVQAAPDFMTGLLIWLANIIPVLNRHGLARFLLVGTPTFILSTLLIR